MVSLENRRSMRRHGTLHHPRAKSGHKRTSRFSIVDSSPRKLSQLPCEVIGFRGLYRKRSGGMSFGKTRNLNAGAFSIQP
jgi:hypothetical protein